MESNGTPTEQKGLSLEPPSTEKNNQSNKTSSLVDRTQLGTTPFYITKTDKGWFLSMGTYILSDTFHSEEALRQWYKDNKWQLIITIVQIAIDVNNKNKHLQDIKKSSL